MGEAFASRLAAAQAGAEWAVADLYRTHAPAISRYLRAHEPQDHPDIASETWLDAARNLHTFSGDEDGFAGWLFTIARRRLIDHRRAGRRRPADPSPDAAFAGITAPSAEDAAVAGTLGDEAARRIVELLPEDQAEIVLLRVVADLDVATVARITGRRAGAVRVAQHRALKRLAEALGDPCNEGRQPSDGTGRDAQTPSSPR